MAGQGASKTAIYRQTMQKQHIVFGKDASCPKNSLSSKNVEALGKAQIVRCLIMVALNGVYPDIPGQFHTLVGAGIIPHQVAQVQDSVRSVFKVADHRLKSFDIRMDIRKNSYPHDQSFQLSI
jgi:hypothetical protein